MKEVKIRMSFPTESTSTYAARNIKSLAIQAYQDTLANKDCADKIDAIGTQIADLFVFIYGYTAIDNSEGIDTDDEILNWTFIDVMDDLNAANWNIACGFYKAAASCLRNALDVSNAALYFQIHENDHSKKNKTGYNSEFSKWDSGLSKTPNWGTTTSLIKKQPNVQKFNSEYSWEFPKDCLNFYHYLCNFSHGRPFANDKTPTNSMNLGYNAPQLEEDLFERFTELAEITIAWISTMWLITFPQILSTDPLGDLSTFYPYKEILNSSKGKDALEFAKKVCNL